MAASSGPEAVKLRVFFIPFFASGHMIPMVDVARLFAARGVDSTIVVTPANAALIRRTIDRAKDSGHPIHLLLYPFPSADVGLPEGQENIGSVSPAETHKIYRAVDLVQQTHDRLLREHRPDCVVADIPYWWTTHIARELGIPRLTFHAVGLFPQLAMNSLQKNRPFEEVADDTQPFVVPCLPDQVEMVRSELPEFLRTPDHLSEVWGKLKEAQLGCFGVICNTFYELEPAYADLYRKTDCRDAWFVGPAALSYSDDDDSSTKAERGGGDNSAAANHDNCMRWLETQKPGSVVFVCFGSWCYFTAEQLGEIASGLEASGHPFLWVVRGGESGGCPWMPEGLEERVAGRGLVVWGWAPQVLILNHRAVGVFVTHCGWNSVLEGVSAGVPMITWPLVFEQFINERLVVQLMKVGVRMWGGFRSTVEEEKVVVKAAEIAKVVAGFMGGGGGGGGEEVEVMRKRAGEYRAMARAAVEAGGTSHSDLSRLIIEITKWKGQMERDPKP